MKSYNKYLEAYAELYGDGGKNYIDIKSTGGMFKSFKTWNELAETLKKKKDIKSCSTKKLSGRRSSNP